MNVDTYNTRCPRCGELYPRKDGHTDRECLHNVCQRLFKLRMEVAEAEADRDFLARKIGTTEKIDDHTTALVIDGEIVSMTLTNPGRGGPGMFSKERQF